MASLFLPQPCGAVAQVLESPIPFLEFIVEEFDQLPRTVLKYIFHQILTFKLTISIENRITPSLPQLIRPPTHLNTSH